MSETAVKAWDQDEFLNIQAVLFDDAIGQITRVVALWETRQHNSLVIALCLSLALLFLLINVITLPVIAAIVVLLAPLAIHKTIFQFYKKPVPQERNEVSTTVNMKLAKAVASWGPSEAFFEFIPSTTGQFLACIVFERIQATGDTRLNNPDFALFRWIQDISATLVKDGKTSLLSSFITELHDLMGASEQSRATWRNVMDAIVRSRYETIVALDDLDPIIINDYLSTPSQYCLYQGTLVKELYQTKGISPDASASIHHLELFIEASEPDPTNPSTPSNKLARLMQLTAYPFEPKQCRNLVSAYLSRPNHGDWSAPLVKYLETQKTNHNERYQAILKGFPGLDVLFLEKTFTCDQICRLFAKPSFSIKLSTIMAAYSPKDRADKVIAWIEAAHKAFTSSSSHQQNQAIEAIENIVTAYIQTFPEGSVIDFKKHQAPTKVIGTLIDMLSPDNNPNAKLACMIERVCMKRTDLYGYAKETSQSYAFAQVLFPNENTLRSILTVLEQVQNSTASTSTATSHPLPKGSIESVVPQINQWFENRSKVNKHIPSHSRRDMIAFTANGFFSAVRKDNIELVIGRCSNKAKQAYGSAGGKS